MRARGRLIGTLALVAFGIGATTGVGIATFSAGPIGAAPAATYVVNDASDSASGSPSACASGSGDCTLRAAITEADASNEDIAITLPDPNDVAHSQAAVYSVNSAMGILDINSGHELDINGAGQSIAVIQEMCSPSCSVSTGVFEILSTGTVAVISGVTIEGGVATSGNGGGIINEESLTLNNSTVTGNTATDQGGGIATDLATSTTLNNDIISDNTAQGNDGGGVFVPSGDLTVTGGTIGGVGSTSPTDQGNHANEGGGAVSFQSSGQATFSGVTIGGTNSTQGNSAGNRAGGVYTQTGDATFSGDTISNNTATNNGGGVYVESGTTSLSDETITSNTANNDQGGGVFIEGGTNTFTGGSIANNTANDDGEGGGVYINGGTNNTFSGGTVTGNTATNTDGSGGGFYVNDGTNTFTGETVNGNTAGGLGDGGGFYIDGGTNTFTGDTVNGNLASGDGGGGGIYFDGGTNTLTGGSLDSNNAYEGAGAFLNGGTESFSQADISGNTAVESGGGVWISVDDVTAPTTITSSTISQNLASGALGEELNGDGGGIVAVGCNQIDLTNDTITGNTSTNFGGGYLGAFCGLVAGPEHTAMRAHATSHVPETPVTNFLFDTITGNTSTNGDGGNIAQEDQSVITLGESIVAGGISDSDPQNCEINNSPPGSFTSNGYNLIDDNTCGTPAGTDIIGQNPQLGALANNGGPTLTELPADNSPAVGAIPDATCVGTGVGEDQRGLARGAGANSSCTIGAVEVGQNFNGYRLVANEGGIFDFGLLFSGSLANNHLNAPIVGLANSPGPAGYLMVGGDGGVFALGGANFFGSLGGQAIPSPIAAIAAPPNETGYWLVAQNGKIYNYGSVPALPALSPPAGAHIVGMASTTDGQGAWMVDNLGDVYAEGSAQYEGGLGGVHINKPIVGIAAAASGQGYILVASDGGTFAYGTQNFFGSVPGSLKPGQVLNAPVVGIAVTHSGKGYWEVGADGGVFTYGDAPFLGSMAGVRLNGPVVGIQHLGSVTASG